MLEGRAMAPHRYCKNGFNNYGHMYLVPMVITFVAVLCMVQLFGLTHWWMDLFYIWIHFCRIMERILLLINVKPVVSTANINIKTVANNFSPVKNSRGRGIYKSVILYNIWNNPKWGPCYDGNYYIFSISKKVSVYKM